MRFKSHLILFFIMGITVIVKPFCCCCIPCLCCECTCAPKQEFTPEPIYQQPRLREREKRQEPPPAYSTMPTTSDKPPPYKEKDGDS
ncbi:uncharacterized protein LOC135076883 isoform X2 [Ostrinia nubilalis]|uniref:uncharacterized protein LOC135076883 isoform X2 n=1 Tax=Ostrinia nubilalis TaxID=29057 RepID=UPI00308220D2